MTTSGADPSPNAQQIEFWNNQGEQRWVPLQEDLDRELGPLGELAMDRAQIARGEQILDVGCGCGATSLSLAERVGMAGRVFGVDISKPMLAKAQERAEQGGVLNARFEFADAQTYAFEPNFDVIYSRFGVMFFADRVAAFSNLLSALRPGGRLAFVCWQDLTKNPIMSLPASIAAKHITMAERTPTSSPGPFAFADGDETKQMLLNAHFEDIIIEPVVREVEIGPRANVEASARFLLQLGPAGSAMREASPEVVANVTTDLRAALVDYTKPEGVVMPAHVWIVTARRGS